MPTSTEPSAATLYRLLAWLSPSFPIGAFSYSHGLEAAAASGAIHDRASLESWIAAIVARGSGRIDADILRDAYRAALAEDAAGLDAANQRGIAYRATAELALEATQQGDAFLNTVRAAWPDAFLDGWLVGEGTCLPAAFGAAAARAGIALEDALLGYLQAFTANLMSAGLRLGLIGQTDGQRILAALEPVVAAAAQAALTRDLRDFGGATFAVDLASMAHETQYSRLFRS
ncbi:MAG TPA: urease accessory UreF family protein [Stellaceae bacterium]|jgi:urease accessory protein|nr:urease accessory UreF family protein [Stellaceae bacterium]